MNNKRLSKFLSILFISAIIVAAVLFNASKPRVMILHSYHPDYPWTRDIDIGIRRVSDQWSDYAQTWYYMDTKRRSDKQWLDRAGIGARRAIDRFDPDVLIAVDDLAQKLAASHYVDDPDMDIVFAGVNGLATAYGYDDADNVTGIFERKPLTAVREMILALEDAKHDASEKPSMLYLMDDSASMQRDRNFVEAFDWGAIDFKGSMVAKDYDEWKNTVASLEQQAIDYLLVANYRKLPRTAADPRIPPATEIMHWTEENSPVPVIGVNVFNVEDGGAIAVGASPLEQGETAANIAHTLLSKNLRGADLPMRINQHYVVAINQDAIRKRNLKLPQIYETFARTTSTYIGTQE